MTESKYSPSGKYSTDYADRHAAGGFAGTTDVTKLPAGWTRTEWMTLIDAIDNMNVRRGGAAGDGDFESDTDDFAGFSRTVPSDMRAKDVTPGAHSSRNEVQRLQLGCTMVETCFARACAAAGRAVDAGTTSVGQLSAEDLKMLSGLRQYKVVLTEYGRDDKRNHIELVDGDTSSSMVNVRPVAKFKEQRYKFVCTTMQHFFNVGNEWRDVHFYADADVADDSGQHDYSAEGRVVPERSNVSKGAGFGGDLAGSRYGVGNAGDTPAYAGMSAAQNDRRPPGSVVYESAEGGGSNVGGGVVRAQRRNIAAKAGAVGQPVAKNYRTSTAVMFNNFGELFQDQISRDYAQVIIEDLFDVWGVPLDQSEAVKYAEDLLWTFIISVTASNKADYNREYDIPVSPVQRSGTTVSVVVADFSLFSKLLASKYGVTRRQFARGVADDQRQFLKRPENQHILPTLATRVGCEVLMAYLAFDGSTHCSDLTTREATFTKTLESRNLFERDDVLATGSSDRLMQGMSGGVRSVAPR